MTVRAERIDAGAVVLRKACAADRDGLIEIMTDREVRAYLGGPRPRADVGGFSAKGDPMRPLRQRGLSSWPTAPTTGLPAP
ncbi:Putative acetyltransferase [Mycobacteroides abscessus]|nr:Putative acetyltransferase [Mycobacteroides abscessus]